MPRDFFKNTLEPTFLESKTHHHSNLRFFKQTSQAFNNLVERLAHEEVNNLHNETQRKKIIKEYRDCIANDCPEYGIIRDVADAEKHIQISRKGRRLTKDSQTEESMAGGWSANAFSKTSFSSLSFDFTRNEIIVYCDDGSEHYGATLLENTYEYFLKIIHQYQKGQT